MVVVLIQTTKLLRFPGMLQLSCYIAVLGTVVGLDRQTCGAQIFGRASEPIENAGQSSS